MREIGAFNIDTLFGETRQDYGHVSNKETNFGTATLVSLDKNMIIKNYPVHLSFDWNWNE